MLKDSPFILREIRKQNIKIFSKMMCLVKISKSEEEYSDVVPGKIFELQFDFHVKDIHHKY